MTEKIIKLFNKAVVIENNISFKDMNTQSIKVGYLVDPLLCNNEVFDYLKTLSVNYNSTFYKSWEDIIDKSSFELYEDQIKHYISTHGTNFEEETYVPSGDVTLPPIKSFKVITPITKEEVCTRCADMIYSGIALNQDVIIDLLDIMNHFEYEIDINRVSNKEALMILYKSMNVLPTKAEEMVRYLVYLATNNTLLIKDTETFSLIRGSNISISSLVERFGVDELSSVFNRFKPLFLAFRTSTENKKCVNRLRNLAKKNHIPMPKGYFNELLSDPSLLITLPSRIGELNMFKKIGLLQTINIRKEELIHRFFPIRNNKLFVSEDVVYYDVNHYNFLYSIIYNSLIEDLTKKATTIKLPIGIDITLPVSAKTFIGNYPLGTSFDLTNSDNIIGINWKNSDGANDLDLSLMTIDGTKYGWNSHYTDDENQIVYSGDMTNANPEATELFYTKNNFKPALVKVSLYSGIPKSKFRFFLATENIGKMQRNYMVNPDNIYVNVDCEMDSREKILGVTTGDRFILAQFRSGNKRVSGTSITDLYTDYALKTLGCYLNLKEVLTDAGFEFVEKDAEIDLCNLSKDTLIKLLS